MLCRIRAPEFATNYTKRATKSAKDSLRIVRRKGFVKPSSAAAFS